MENGKIKIKSIQKKQNKTKNMKLNGDQFVNKVTSNLNKCIVNTCFGMKSCINLKKKNYNMTIRFIVCHLTHL